MGNHRFNPRALGNVIGGTSLSGEVLDQFQRPVQPNDLVAIGSLTPLVYKVVSVRPVLNPQAPPGVLQLRVLTEALVNVQAGAPTPNLVLVMQAPAPSDAAPSEDTPADPSPIIAKS